MSRCLLYLRIKISHWEDLGTPESRFGVVVEKLRLARPRQGKGVFGDRQWREGKPQRVTTPGYWICLLVYRCVICTNFMYGRPEKCLELCSTLIDLNRFVIYIIVLLKYAFFSTSKAYLIFTCQNLYPSSNKFHF